MHGLHGAFQNCRMSEELRSLGVESTSVKTEKRKVSWSAAHLVFPFLLSLAVLFFGQEKLLKILNMLGHAQIYNLERSSLAIASARGIVGGRL